jgi:hypothetical protein
MEKKALEDKKDLELDEVMPITLEVDEDPSESLDQFFDSVVEEVDDWNEENEGKDPEDVEPKEIFFKLDLIPGAIEDEFIEEEEPVEIEEEIPEDVDPWDWERQGGTPSFLDWIQRMFEGVPKHSGKDTTGVERALAYFERLDREISNAMKKDYKREIDAAKAEQAREEIEKGITNLIDRLEKLKTKKFRRRRGKKAAFESSLVKEAETTTTGKIIVTVPYFISNIARACIESVVQAGKDMEECYNKFAKDYDLDNREKFQLATLIKDMGYPVLLDRVNFGEDDILPSKSRVSEYHTQYYA